MAMFTTYIALIVINHTHNYWLGFVAGHRRPGLVLGRGGGAGGGPPRRRGRPAAERRSS